MKSVYSAVRTGSLNKAVCASTLKARRYLHVLLVLSLNNSKFQLKPNPQIAHDSHNAAIISMKTKPDGLCNGDRMGVL